MTSPVATVPTQADSPAPDGRSRRLDGLRGVAILLVLWEHFGAYPRGIVSPGYYGVDLFFVISGCLITSILARNADVPFGRSLRDFLIRRSLRIFPPYYLLLSVLFALNVSPARESWLPLVSYTWNYRVVDLAAEGRGNPLFYLWSLSVEEQFYLVWPLLVLGLRRHPRALAGVVMGVAAVGFLHAYGVIAPQWHAWTYTSLLSRMASLAVGAIAALIPRQSAILTPLGSSRAVEWVLLAGLAALLVTAWKWAWLLLPFCSACLVLKALHFGFRTAWIDRMLTSRRLVFCGLVSYSIYLWHVPLGNAVVRWVVDPVWKGLPWESFGPLAKLRWHSWLVKLPLITSASVALAALSWRWFEAPLLKLKDRLAPRDRPTASDA